MSRARSLRSVYLALDIADAGGYPGLDVREIVSQLELFDEKNAATILKNSGIITFPVHYLNINFCENQHVNGRCVTTATTHHNHFDIVSGYIETR